MVARVGQLRERVTISSETRVADGGGGFTATWSALHSGTLPARVQPLPSFAERIEGQSLAGVQRYRVEIRYRSDVDTGMRVAWGSVIMNIRSVTNPDERRRRTMLECEAAVAT